MTLKKENSEEGKLYEIVLTRKEVGELFYCLDGEKSSDPEMRKEMKTVAYSCMNTFGWD